MTDFTVDMGVVKNAMRANFAARLRGLFEPALGLFPELAGEQPVEQHFMLLIHHASSEGYARRNLCVKYAFIATHLGMFFRFDPLFHDLREAALSQKSGVHQIVGLNRMFDHVDLMIAEGLINRNTGFVPGLIEACKMPENVPPSEVISHIVPKRAQAFGSVALDRAFAAATHECSTGSALSGCNPRDVAIACHFLGHGFWLDPLYNWVPTVLAKEGLAGLGDRVNV